jgi:hypothetical protein
MGATGCGNGGYGCHRLESTPSSAYYQTRRGQRRKDDVPVSRLMVCGNLFPCRVQIAQWPCNDEIATRNRHVHVLGQVHRVRCNDESASRNLLAKALAQVFPQPLVADAGYDAECVHELCRERWRVNSWIPLAVRSRNGQVQSHRWRPGSMTHVPRWQRLDRKGQVQSPPAASANQAPRWQRLVGMAKCNPTVGGRGQ